MCSAARLDVGRAVGGRTDGAVRWVGWVLLHVVHFHSQSVRRYVVRLIEPIVNDKDRSIGKENTCRRKDTRGREAEREREWDREYRETEEYQRDKRPEERERERERETWGRDRGHEQTVVRLPGSAAGEEQCSRCVAVSCSSRSVVERRAGPRDARCQRPLSVLFPRAFPRRLLPRVAPARSCALTNRALFQCCGLHDSDAGAGPASRTGGAAFDVLEGPLQIKIGRKSFQ